MSNYIPQPGHRARRPFWHTNHYVDVVAVDKRFVYGTDHENEGVVYPLTLDASWGGGDPRWIQLPTAPPHDIWINVWSDLDMAAEYHETRLDADREAYDEGAARIALICYHTDGTVTTEEMG